MNEMTGLQGRRKGGVHRVHVHPINFQNKVKKCRFHGKIGKFGLSAPLNLEVHPLTQRARAAYGYDHRILKFHT